MARETRAERNAREAQQREEYRLNWEKERPMRLLEAMARCERLGVSTLVYHKAGQLAYSFYFDVDGYNTASGLFCELEESTMQWVESKLDEVQRERDHHTRMKNLKEDVLKRLTDEEREALGF